VIFDDFFFPFVVFFVEGKKQINLNFGLLNELVFLLQEMYKKYEQIPSGSSDLNFWLLFPEISMFLG
jgi:hypothetical protein